MIKFLFSLVFAEMTVMVLLVFKTPLRKFVIMGVDRVKRDRGPVVVKTVAATVFLLMVATVYNAAAIQKVSPTDQALLAKYLLEGSLMGFSLFLALMVDRLHHYFSRNNMEAVKKHDRVFDREDIKVLEDEMCKLHGMICNLETALQEKSQRISKLETTLQEKSKEAGSAEANALALKKQSEGILLEYDRLFQENQTLRTQLESVDRKFSFSEGKKCK